MYEEIAEQVRVAALAGSKIAMFHFQVLKNAQALSNDEPIDFCRRIGVPESYATEFRKMLALAQVIKRHGLTISKA